MAHSGKTITFATDLLPNEDNIYKLGNNDQRWKIYGELQPIAVKTYTAALYNSSSGANYYQTFATVTPADYNAIWIAHYKITITASGHSDYTEICDVSISGRSNTYYSYKIYNSLVTYSIYSHVLLNGSSASYPHELGYRMASSYGATDVQKTVKVELLEQINCTITLLDNLKLYTSAVPTNYSAWRTFNATSNGLQETGDANDTAAYVYSNGFKGQVGSNKIYPYTLFARTGNGKYESFVLSSTTAASKSVNTHGFLPEGKIYYNSGSGTYNEGTLNFNSYQQYHVVDYRYSFNINNSTLPDYCETYLVWTYNTTDGLLYLDTTQWLATALPSSADGKIYQRIGSKYYTGTSNYYQGSLLLDNLYYEYKNGALHEWNGRAVDAATINGLTVQTAVPENAVFTDHYAWDDITNKPTTLSGYGITDAMAGNTNVNHVFQDAVTYTDYTNWRPLVWGNSNSATEGFTPADSTAGVFTAASLSCQPSTGTIRAMNLKLVGSASSKIIYTDGTNAKDMIQFVKGNTNGHMIKIGGGACTVVAAGESVALAPTATAENLYLLADATTYVYANADTTANRTGFAITTSGHILPQKAEAANNNKQNLGASDNKWANVYATTFTGNVTGNVTGDVTGNVTGNLTGNVTGDVTGTTSNATTTADTTNTMYLVGVKSGATTTLLYDANLTISNTTIAANNALYLKTTASNSLIFQRGDTYVGAFNTSSNLVLGIGDSATWNTVTSFKLYVHGKTLLNNSTASSTDGLSSQLIIRNNASSPGNVAIELVRGSQVNTTYTSWQIAVESGDLHLRSNYNADGSGLNTAYTYDAFSLVRNTGSATFKGSVTATTYYGALQCRSSTGNLARHVWFSYSTDGTAEDEGVLGNDDDFKYNPNTNVLTVGKLTITGGTANSSMASSGTLTIGNATKALTVSTTTAALTISTTNGALEAKSTGTGTVKLTGTSGAMTISTTTGALTIQTNSSTNNTGNMIIQTAGTKGTITLESKGASVSIKSKTSTEIDATTSLSLTSTTSTSLAATTTMSISSTTSTSISATTTMSITGTQGTTITSGTGYATIFKINTTEYGRFNINGMFQLNDTGTQNTHKLYVNGDSAFNGKIAIGEQSSNAIIENVYMQWNETDQSLDFIFA